MSACLWGALVSDISPQHIQACERQPQVQKEETKADSKQQKLLEDMKKGGLDKATAQKVSTADELINGRET